MSSSINDDDISQIIPEKVQTVSSFWKEIFHIENLVFKEEIKVAEIRWSDNFNLYDNIISDIVFMHIKVVKKEFKEVQQIQIYWQKVMDKLERDDILLFYFGWYFYHLGTLYYELSEFEVSIQHFGKADSYFTEVNFHYGQFIVQGEIAQTMEDLGAIGDARYHLREQIRREGYNPKEEEIIINFIKQGDLYLLSGNYEKSLEAYKSAEDKLSKSDQIGLQVLLINKLKKLYKEFEYYQLSNKYHSNLQDQIKQILSSSNDT